MWKKLALGALVIVAVLVAIVAVQPAAFTVERSIAIQAPAEIVYGHIQNLRAMDAWSPYARMDPKMKIEYAGPEAGPGARSAWEGPRMGRGRLTITDAKPAQVVEMKLEMLAPIKATNRVRFSLAPEGEATRVTWRMDGAYGFVGKAMGLVMDVDSMVGGQFEQGLASLKAVAEADSKGRQGDVEGHDTRG